MVGCRRRSCPRSGNLVSAEPHSWFRGCITSGQQLAQGTTVVPRILKKILRGFEKEGHSGAIAASFARNLCRRDKTRELTSTED